MIYVISASGRFEQQRREDAKQKSAKAKFGFTCQVNLTPQRQGAQSAHERFVIGLCHCTQDFVPTILLLLYRNRIYSQSYERYEKES